MAIGKCNHKSVCARCSLRLIMLYQDTKCPLCKADLEQVSHSNTWHWYFCILPNALGAKMQIRCVAIAVLFLPSHSLYVGTPFSHANCTLFFKFCNIVKHHIKDWMSAVRGLS